MTQQSEPQTPGNSRFDAASRANSDLESIRTKIFAALDEFFDAETKAVATADPLAELSAMAESREARAAVQGLMLAYRNRASQYAKTWKSKNRASQYAESQE